MSEWWICYEVWPGPDFLTSSETLDILAKRFVENNRKFGKNMAAAMQSATDQIATAMQAPVQAMLETMTNSQTATINLTAAMTKPKNKGPRPERTFDRKGRRLY